VRGCERTQTLRHVGVGGWTGALLHLDLKQGTSLPLVRWVREVDDLN
jgi:hypothetical protein